MCSQGFIASDESLAVTHRDISLPTGRKCLAVREEEAKNGYIINITKEDKVKLTGLHYISTLRPKAIDSTSSGIQIKM